MSFNLTGLPAILAILGICFVFVYIPIKLVTIAVARAGKKAERLNLLQQRSVIAEYDPPAGLSPAEMGFLIDAKLGIEEFYATVISLEQAGLVQLNNDQNKLQVVSVLPAPPNTKPFEVFVLDRLGEQTNQFVDNHWLKSHMFQAEMTIKSELYEAGYLLSIHEQIKRSIRVLILIMALLMLWFPILGAHPRTIGGIIGTIAFLIIFSPVYFIISLFSYSTYKKIAGEPWLGTPLLKQTWSDIEGYRHFIEVVDADKLQFESEDSKTLVKNKTLPYAIALGFNTGWREQI